MPDDPTTQQPISDDQELAKVLAGVSQQIDEPAGSDQAMVPPVPEFTTEQVNQVTNDALSAPVLDTSNPAPIGGGGELDSIKLEALQELRPLVDKLNVSAEEKFDTYLLLLRSTDDRDLIAPAHEAAKGITDEARRAQALLDIIKEIDFLSQNQK